MIHHKHTEVFMKNAKRILALAGVILLVAMYVLTLIFSLFKSPVANMLFRASFMCTFIIPIFIYANILVFQYLQNKKERDQMKNELNSSTTKNDSGKA